MQLDGKIALISGGARGLGAAHARALVAEGARVVLGDLLDEEGAALAAALGDAARYIHLDVTEEDSWAAAVAYAEAEFGVVDVLVNNAGIANAGPIDHYPRAKLEAVLAVNVMGVIFGMQAVIPAMKLAGRGSIINISSVEGLAGGAGLHGYVASKFAVRGVTKSVAVEVGSFGIRVNSVHPGYIITPMTERLDPASVTVPLGRPGQPDDVSRMVVYLASEESRYSTGAEFVVDGGMTAGLPPN